MVMVTQFRLPRASFALAAPLALGACATASLLTDPQAGALAEAVQSEAATLFTALGGQSAPQCSYEQNKNLYDRLAVSASLLQSHLATGRGSPALIRAADALARAIDDARSSHALASARSDDAFGLCMAPGAIALNADAINRASAAIGQAHSGQGDR